jgi:CRISPR-associated protein Csx3
MNAMNLLPAILIGGPPHSGKSVLAYSLSQALRSRNVPHYLMRAAPDGEGDWSQEMDEARMNAIRFKGPWDECWVNVVCRDLAARPMPLLVDVGGKPTPEQYVIFDQCTGAILLTRDDAAADQWRRIVTSRGLPIIADLRSVLAGEGALWPAVNGELRGVVSGLQRGRAPASGPAFDALVERLATIFAFSQEELTHMHMASAPEDARVVNFDELARQRYPNDPQHRFVEADVDTILDSVPATEPIAAYGRIPAWLATALGARCNLRWQFDVRLGWVRTPCFVMGNPGKAPTNPWLAFRITEVGPGRVQLDASKRQYYLDYQALDGLPVPHIPSTAHVTINGPDTSGGGLPLWVFAALGHVYRGCAGVQAQQMR